MTARQAIAEALAPATFRAMRRELGHARMQATRYRNERDVLLGAIARLQTAEARGEGHDQALDHLYGSAMILREGNAALNTQVHA